jgi:hypothetical protein
LKEEKKINVKTQNKDLKKKEEFTQQTKAKSFPTHQRISRPKLKYLYVDVVNLSN